jgi:uncharacterized protein
MNTHQELKIVFSGPMGAGKTTAIRAISDIPPISTEVANTDQESCAKETTTVAMDYGQLTLADGTTVKLYGTPGQTRFAFMWEILCSGALGVILLIDGSAASGIDDFRSFIQSFRKIRDDQPFVIGVGRLADNSGSQLNEYADELVKQGVVAPLFGVDVRNREDVLLLIETLLCMLEVQVQEAADVGT